MVLHWSKAAKFILGVTSLTHIFGSYFFLRWIPARPILLLLIGFFAVNVGLSGALFFRKPPTESCKDQEKDEVQPRGKREITKGDIRRRNVGSKAQEPKSEQVAGAAQSPPPRIRRKPSLLLKANLIIQVALMLLVFDFTFTSRVLYHHNDLTFSRVAWVNDSSVHIFSRFPKQGQLKIEYKKALVDKWDSLVSQEASSESDFTSIVKIDGLEPGTRYQYRFSDAQNVRMSDVEVLPKPLSGEDVYTFTTSPVPFSRTKLYFGAGSCIKPDFPYTPLFNKGIRGFKALNQFDFQYLLFLGDFIYAEALRVNDLGNPNLKISCSFNVVSTKLLNDTPFYFGPSVGSYRKFYRQIYADADVRAFTEKVPVFHAYDDHEILNNWDKKKSFPFENAMSAFSEYQGYGPSLTSDEGNSYYPIVHGDIGFFFWDTRRFRSSGADADGPGKTMLGEVQKESFKQWIRETKDTLRVRFVISSVPLTYNWVIADAAQDTWKGYKFERQELLEFLAPIPNVFFLSGDRHEVAVVNLPFNQLEFSLSPINQFFGPIQTFQAQGLAPEFDPTLLYYRHGNVKFGGFFVDTQSRSDGRPLLAVTVYSDMPDNLRANHFDPKVIASVPEESLKNLKVSLASIRAKVVSNFDFSAEMALQGYLEKHLYTEDEDSLVAPVLHLFWLGE